MTGGHQTIESRRAEIEDNRDRLTPGPDKTVCYTSGGRKPAEDYAKVTGKTTLEQTPYGRQMDAEGLHFPGGIADWQAASRVYAQQAEGDVTVIVGEDGTKKIEEYSTFAQIERDELLKNEKVRTINSLDRKHLSDLEPGQVNKYVEDSSAMELDGTLTPEERLKKQRGLQDALRKDADHARKREDGPDPVPAKQTSPNDADWGDEEEPCPWVKKGDQDASKGKGKSPKDPEDGPKPGGGRRP